MTPLPERIEALNYSLDPWERTEAAPQGWANHLQQLLVLIQGYIQLRPQAPAPLPASALCVPRRLLDQVIRMLLCSLLPGALGRHLRLLASSLGRLFARIPADIAELNLVMLALSMTITPAMTVSSIFCTLKECLVPHSGPRCCRGVILGVHNVPPCVSHTICTFA